MKNLLEETKEALAKYGKSFDDVLWIGSADIEISKEKFIELADRRYDDGYGAPEVARDLLVVGAGFWLSRSEYDGSEWWEYNTYPKRPSKKTENINSLICQHPYNDFVGWKKLKNLAEASKQWDA